jgi:hypothetical protein
MATPFQHLLFPLLPQFALLPLVRLKSHTVLARITIYDAITQSGRAETNGWDPSLTYGTLRREKTPERDQNSNNRVFSFYLRVFMVTKVLGFEAFFTEAVPFSDLETERVRRVAINYFLDDKSILIKGKVASHVISLLQRALQRRKLPVTRVFPVACF